MAPCIVTARRIQDMPLVQQAFEEGAFDCILKPVVRYQAVPTIQTALWLFQLRNNIEYRRHTLKVLKDQTEALSIVPAQKVDRISLIKDLITSHDRTLAAIEHSIEVLTRTATEVEQKARERALACLNEWPSGL